MKPRDRELGMGRKISRRDFIDGARVAVTGALVFPWAEARAQASEEAVSSVQGAEYYPPALTGMRGSHPGSYDVAHALRDGRRWQPTDSGETYDLVVVGGGISGLAAAYFFRQEAGPGARILVLDNHDDFGGHAKRNEFTAGDRMLLANGGVELIEDYALYGEAAKGLISALGIEPERYSEYVDRETYRKLGLQRGVFFDRETFGADHLAVGQGSKPWAEFFAGAPLSERVKKDLIRLHKGGIDYLPGLSPEEKRARLRGMTYKEFLLDLAKVDAGVLPYLQSLDHTYWNVGIDSMLVSQALWTGSPGLDALGLPAEELTGAAFRFPDGNASICRLMVRSMIPEVAPAGGLEDIVTARFDYSKLDRKGAAVRIRLNSTAVHVEHVGDAKSADTVDVTYVRNNVAETVHARQCVLAGYHAMIPHLCPELPAPQRKALSYALKAPLVYTRVLLRDWTSFANLKLFSAYCPRSYHTGVRLSDLVNIGSYECPRTPKEPMVLQLARVPLSPGLPIPDQWKAGRQSLLTTTFETFEREIRDQLGRILSAGGFDPARDIEAITVNRWPHGYAWGYDPESGDIHWTTEEWPEEKRTWERARRPFGRIAIANSDAGAWAMTEVAIGQAHRAVHELLSG
ncbi:MAG: FAD-dependent oxidoreductase [Myxococcales bacterium]|nr:FAD-dependent oxidoreductase [Myxococcales bacterium]